MLQARDRLKEIRAAYNSASVWSCYKPTVKGVFSAMEFSVSPTETSYVSQGTNFVRFTVLVVLHQIGTGRRINLKLIIMKNSKAILLAIFASVFAVLTVVNMSLASPKSAGENTLDMLEIMTRAFDEGEGGSGCCYCTETTYRICDAPGVGDCIVIFYFPCGSVFGQHTLGSSVPGVHHMVCVVEEIVITPCNCVCNPPWQGETRCPVCCPLDPSY